MGERERYPPGTFSWAELGTTDAAAAKAFYAKVLRWEAAGDRFTVGGRAVAALREGGEPRWSSYVTVEDVDAAVAKARELGGEVPEEPRDVAEAGRTAAVRDPAGAAVRLWQPQGHHGAGRVNEPGCMVWNELATPDLEAARAFYRGLFGWTLEPEEGTGYEVVKAGGKLNGGLRAPQDGEAPQWLVYFTAPGSCEAAAGEVREAGGRVLAGPMDTGVGRIAVVADPQGATFALFEGEIDP
jgi:predicted enzyme related to lactoylglutathione lyase